MLNVVIPPDKTSDPKRAKEWADYLVSSEQLFSQPDEPSNKVKMDQIRTVFDDPRCDIFTHYPIEEIMDLRSPDQVQAISFLADLRCQYLRGLKEKGLIDAFPVLIGLIRNYSIYVQAREFVRMYLETYHGRHFQTVN